MSQRFWIGVASKEHVLIGKEGGFCQLNHGKKTALNRMKKGDYIIYYSPKYAMNDTTPYQCFVAVGKIKSDTYQAKMTESFHPFRRDVIYLKQSQDVSLHAIEDDELTAVKSSLRYGHVEISKALFMKIVSSMQVKGEDDDSI